MGFLLVHFFNGGGSYTLSTDGYYLFFPFNVGAHTVGDTMITAGTFAIIIIAPSWHSYLIYNNVQTELTDNSVIVKSVSADSAIYRVY